MKARGFVTLTVMLVFAGVVVTPPVAFPGWSGGPSLGIGSAEAARFPQQCLPAFVDTPTFCGDEPSFQGKKIVQYGFDKKWKKTGKGEWTATEDNAEFQVQDFAGKVQSHKFKKGAKVTRDGDWMEWDSTEEIKD